MTTPDSPDHSWLYELERSQIVRTVLRAFLSAASLVAIYYLAPIPHHSHPNATPHVLVALGVFAVAMVFEVRKIVQSDQPMLRAGVALATLLPLFLVLFAWIYLVMSQASLTSFGTHLSRSSALYFAITVFSTVGFGDITAKTDPARLVVSIQMLADLVVIAVVVRIIFGAASRGQHRKSLAAEPTE